MTETLLSIKDLSITFTQYGRFLKPLQSTPIRSLNLEVKKGELLAIIGASGSGKSLLAHAIMDILPKNATISGDMFYSNQLLTSRRIKQLRGKAITLIPQSVNYLDPSMKVKHQVRLGISKNAKMTQEKLFQQFGLKESDGDLYPFQLSGGMLRRVLFTTCISDTLSLIIADEPTPGLHPDAQQMVLEQLRSFANHGISVIFITHDIIAASQIADRIAVFKKGKVIETAPASFFSENGDQLQTEFARNLWRSLPQQQFLKGISHDLRS
ncbi:ATP-binding cassette domain-containing protein [Streptococcus dysgalactiae]|uniref:ATP-binding cassette domain-containing protein n=1 Tax=Streptococcus dysgalactiae TaxID=1334 RepID=UPI0001F864CB|nr:ABC transporter ATP-binding protein [Streptococcus dysgalactiae]EFY03296.1 ATPase protein [Streptococcus dysgalactiae subsp. dysgalactiae ATCC 27957]MCB2847750.1 ABC transporter ATP-binding protein [Streptococcus dysgalactiae subsp. dysgalactiae]